MQIRRYNFDNVENTKQAIIKECIKQEIILKTQQAYILATIQWETANTFKPVQEAFWKKTDAEEWRKLNLRYYPFYGRGFIQITWKKNYQIFSDILGVDLVYNPDLCLDPDISLFIAIYGFKNGVFTGVNIEKYINENQTDYLNARKCINGMDKAKEISDIAKIYLNKL